MTKPIELWPTDSGHLTCSLGDLGDSPDTRMTVSQAGQLMVILAAPPPKLILFAKHLIDHPSKIAPGTFADLRTHTHANGARSVTVEFDGLGSSLGKIAYRYQLRPVVWRDQPDEDASNLLLGMRK